MVVIRLTRVGKKNSPAYRVVVAEKRRAVKRKFIEVIGHYNPTKKPKEVIIARERALFWLKAGAQPSNTVRNLMADLEIIPKKEKINIKYARSKKKKELKEEKAAKPLAQVKSDSVDKEAKEEATKDETENLESKSIEEPKEENKEEGNNDDTDKIASKEISAEPTKKEKNN